MGIPTLLVNDTTPDGHFGCTRVVRAVRALAERSGLELVGVVPVGTPLAASPWRDRLREVRLVVVNGEGTLHHGRPAARALVEVAGIAAEHRVPAALVNASWFENPPDLLAGALGFGLIAMRESRSAAPFRAAGREVRVVADLALHAPMPERPRAGVGFTESVVPTEARALADAARRLGARPINIHHGRPGPEALLHLVRTFGVRAAGGLRVRARAARAAVRFARARVPSPEAFDDQIAALELLVTGRFHGAILALAALTPLLAVESNTPKISSTLADAGLEPWRVVRAEALDADVLARASRWHGTERERLTDFVADQRRRQVALFADLARLAS